MAHNLLSLPPELLTLILTYLPIHSLLHFSLVSHHARILANSNLHTLTLGIQPVHSKISPCPLTKGHCPSRINVRISSATKYDYTTLLNFHNALVQSILLRHADTLHTLNIELWTLTRPAAEAIAKLCALRDLSVRLEDNVYVRAVPRGCVSWERKQQDKAWNFLAENAKWKRRLRALRLRNAEITTGQLGRLIRESGAVEELCLRRCRYVDEGIWKVLGEERWGVRGRLRKLVLEESAGVLKEGAFRAIEGMGRLEDLDLYGCYGTSRDEVEQWNQNVWHIPRIVLPSTGLGDDIVLEIDPAYLDT